MIDQLIFQLQTSRASAAQRYAGIGDITDFYTDTINTLQGVAGKLAALNRKHHTPEGMEAKQAEFATEALTKLNASWQKSISNLHQNASQQAQELGITWVPTGESEMGSLRRELREGEIRRFHAKELADPVQAQAVLQGYTAAGNIESARAIANSPVPLVPKAVLDQAQLDLGVALNPTKAKMIQGVKAMAAEITSTLAMLQKQLIPDTEIQYL